MSRPIDIGPFTLEPGPRFDRIALYLALCALRRRLTFWRGW